MLNQETIDTARKNGKIGYRIQCLETTDSTNLDIRRAAMEGEAHGLVVTAESQLAGRGRRGRNWESVTGQNLYFSLLLLPEVPQENASMITVAAALAVTEAIRDIGIDAKIKWPNDVVAEGRKLCGILTELGWRADGRYFVILGIGVNVNQQIFGEEIRDTASSLYLQTSVLQEREVLLAQILDRFAEVYKAFESCGDLSCLREAYEALLVNCGQTVRVLDPKGEWTGVAEGINDRGELLVRNQQGTVEAVYAGEVSVRGIYGYV